MTALRSTSRAAGEAGFTLLELLAVLAMMGLAAALVLPRSGTGREQVAVRSAAIQLAADLRAVRTQAMASSRETAFILDSGTRRYWADGTIKVRSLPNGIGVVSGQSPGIVVASERVVVQFQPDGSSTGGWIRLQSKTRAADVTIDWLTGTARVQWVR